VVIETDRGLELGEQVSLTCNGCEKSVSREQIKRYIDNSGGEFYRLNSGRILREATPQDLAEQEHLNAAIKEAVNAAALLAAQLDLDMKVVTAEHLLGGERIVFYFRSESRVDFRSLVKELAHQHHTRIEMRQVGARDEARLVADYEVCGRECCCKNFLKKLRPVNMKMAKLQKSTLDPSKVSGRCGRLRCCLRYEHEGYEALNAKLPRVGARVETEFGLGVVIDRQILTQLLLIRTDSAREVTIPIEEVRLSDAPLPVMPEPQPYGRGGPRERPLRPADGQPAGEAREDRPAPDRADSRRQDRAQRPRVRDDAPPQGFEDGPADDGPPDGPPGQLSEGGPGDGPPRRRRGRRRRRRRGGEGPPPADGAAPDSDGPPEPPDSPGLDE
jgi:cell fate regulator YaaT (PSP1 superfamily)